MPEKRHDGLRKFNRTIFNPIIKLFAGRFLYSLVRHTGRRSGKEYATPVVAVRKENAIFIPLPYGANTDWLLNVQAKGGCAVTVQGQALFSQPTRGSQFGHSTPRIFPNLSKGFQAIKN